MRWFALLTVVVVGCTGANAPVDPASGSNNPNGIPQNAPLDPAFAPQALRIAGEYKAWGRVDDELRWAPFLCRQPAPGRAHVSASTHMDTHGQKLYSVFVKDHENYPAKSLAGQVVVKESFVPERVDTPPPAYDYQHAGAVEADHFQPYAQKDGVTFRAGAPAGLFIMFKTAETSSDATDLGWVYATVSPAGEVTAAGKIQTCMTCHEDAPHDRLFGVQQSPY